MFTSSCPRSCVSRSGAQPGGLRDESAGASPGYPKACPQPYPHSQALRTARRDRVIAVGCAAFHKMAEAASCTDGERRPQLPYRCQGTGKHRRSRWRTCEGILHTSPLTQRGRAPLQLARLGSAHRRASDHDPSLPIPRARSSRARSAPPPSRACGSRFRRCTSAGLPSTCGLEIQLAPPGRCKRQPGALAPRWR